jgi:hypothetical protein
MECKWNAANYVSESVITFLKVRSGICSERDDRDYARFSSLVGDSVLTLRLQQLHPHRMETVSRG